MEDLLLGLVIGVFIGIWLSYEYIKNNYGKF